MIKIRDLAVTKAGRTICRVEQLDIQCGERLAISGANGVGKTTLLRVLAGLERDFEGSLEVDASARQTVFVHQSPYLFRGSVMFNVTYGLQRKSTSAAKQLAQEWLGRMGIAHLANRGIDGLSGGERRRVALARAMIIGPRLLLLDEPLAEMDVAGIAAAQLALDTLEESTVVIASPAELPESMVQRVHRL